MPLNILLLEDVHASADPVLTPIPGAAIRRLRHAPDATELKELLADVDVLGLRSRTQLDASALAAAPRLRAVGAYCTGTNNIDLKTADIEVVFDPVWDRTMMSDAAKLQLGMMW